MENEEVKQLVILGNGFDLHFKQKTKFEDYIYSLLEPTSNKELNNKIKGVEKQCGMTLNDKPDIRKNLDNIMQFVDSKNKDENTMLLLYLAKSCEILKSKVACNQKSIIRRAADNVKETMQSISLLNNKNPLKSSEPSNMEIMFNKERERRIDILNEQKIKILEKAKTNVKFNFWEAYFIYLCKDALEVIDKNWNWSDVEARILDFYNLEINDNYTRLCEIINETNEDKYLDSVDNFVKMVKEESELDFTLENDTDDYLYNELVEFSKNFSSYLKAQFNEFAKDEEGNSISAFINEKIADGQKYELLNFNYTNIEDSNCTNQIHIHGELNSNDNLPIIGINISGLKNNEQHAFKLTKQYQLISSRSNTDNLKLRDIKKIIFYGHSLALADYQYFKSIFDRVHLIDSSVELIFKYSFYNLHTREEISKELNEKKRKEMLRENDENRQKILKENYDRVFELLKRYSDDVNVDVITTLMLDGRVKLQKV